MITLSSRWAKPLMKKGNIRFSPDLGLSFSYATSDGNLILFPDGQTIPHSAIKQITEDKRHVYGIRDNQIFKLAISSGGKMYKLTPSDGAPTFEISGIRMHPIKGVTPESMVKRVITKLKVSKRDNVLDICTGLGYMAQESAKHGADVTTIEIDKNVIELSKFNPWSKDFWEFAEKGKIRLIIGDAFKVVDGVGKNYSVIVHDPPRFALAGELYSLEFYKKIFNAGKPGCRLYHYTGSPGERFRKKSVVKGVVERLRTAGWRRVNWFPDIQGVLAVKPRH